MRKQTKVFLETTCQADLRSSADENYFHWEKKNRNQSQKLQRFNKGANGPDKITDIQEEGPENRKT